MNQNYSQWTVMRHWSSTELEGTWRFSALQVMNLSWKHRKSEAKLFWRANQIKFLPFCSFFFYICPISKKYHNTFMKAENRSFEEDFFRFLRWYLIFIVWNKNDSCCRDVAIWADLKKRIKVCWDSRKRSKNLSGMVSKINLKNLNSFLKC